MTQDPNSPQVLLSAANQVEAGVILTALDGYGIKAMMTGAFTSGFQAEAPGAVQVIVRYGDLDRARLALAEIRRLSSGS